MTAPQVRKEADWVVSNALTRIPGEVPLAWIATVFWYYATTTERTANRRMLPETIDSLLPLCPGVSISLQIIGENVTDNSTPENLLLQADTFARDDSTSSTEKLTALMRDHVLPTLLAAEKLDGNDAFTPAEEENGGDVIEQDGDAADVALPQP